MEPNLLIGDRLFVSKYTYGYSRHSLPFSPKIYNNRILKKIPKRGDVIVFKTPADNRTDYIKRLIGLPGDTVQIINKNLYLNEVKVNKRKIDTLLLNINCAFPTRLLKLTYPTLLKKRLSFEQSLLSPIKK